MRACKNSAEVREREKGPNEKGESGKRKRWWEEKVEEELFIAALKQ